MNDIDKTLMLQNWRWWLREKAPSRYSDEMTDAEAITIGREMLHEAFRPITAAFETMAAVIRDMSNDLIRFGAVAMHEHRKRLGLGPAEYARIWHLTPRQYRALEKKRLGRLR